ncbi:uncharacterized protein LOC114727958 [Neltuma alba]|uniref:uncharacterized protein LOC114727958 n=1 Tax=Neltuma alba TaxID=207710 RepID=UPI0010A4BBB6|nr:uncharacterized protein LOC114727958 [Prosopis alba]
MASTAIPELISLRVVVDKEQNRVLYAEAGKDFVDILLSFLTLPLGTITRLVSKDSNTACRFGCISLLYESVGNLDPKHLKSETCKQMLLQPRNSMERYNQNLKLNIDDTKPTKYYACGHCLFQGPSLVSTFKNMKCICGRVFTFLLNPCKSLLCSPVVGGSDKNASGNDTRETALTDSLLRKEHSLVNFENSFKITARPGRENTGTMKMKVLIRKSKFKMLCAQVEEDFIDQLLSFLTFPIGAVEGVLEGNSGLCPSRLSCCNNYAVGPYYLTTADTSLCVRGVRRIRICDPKSPIMEDKSGNGYAKGRTKFMVADDLSVKPLSSHNVLSPLTEFKVPYHDLEQRTICIAVREVVSILKASMVSKSALTIGLKEFLSNNVKKKGKQRR